VLEEAIQHYDGTVIVVSAILFGCEQNCRNSRWRIRIYRGDYHYYLDKISEEKEQARLAAIAAEKPKLLRLLNAK